MIARKFAFNLRSALTAGGTLLCGVTLWTASYSQTTAKLDAPLKVALALDSITQTRFQDDMANFGLSRMVHVAGGHLTFGRLMLETQQDRDLFKACERSHRDFAVGFFHCLHATGDAVKASAGIRGKERPAVHSTPSAAKTQSIAQKAQLKPPKPEPEFTDPAERVSQISNHLIHLHLTHRATTPDSSALNEDTLLFREMGRIAQNALPKLMKGQGVEQETADWLTVMRPVRATKASCLHCHTGAKQGDTLGVMTYVVSKRSFINAPAPPNSKSDHASAF